MSALEALKNILRLTNKLQVNMQPDAAVMDFMDTDGEPSVLTKKRPKAAPAPLHVDVLRAFDQYKENLTETVREGLGLHVDAWFSF